MQDQHEDRKWKFDPTINLGHIITFIGFLATVAVGWTTLDKRVLVLEEARNTQAQIDRHQDQSAQQQMQYIRETLSEIKRSVDKLNDRYERSR